MKHLLLTTIAAVLVVGCGEAKLTEAELALIGAAEDGNIELVKQHIAAGTDVNAKEKYTGYTPLHYAAVGGRTEIAELLITAGADVNARDAHDFTPLVFAIHFKHSETADLLRKHGAKGWDE